MMQRFTMQHSIQSAMLYDIVTMLLASARAARHARERALLRATLMTRRRVRAPRADVTRYSDDREER